MDQDQSWPQNLFFFFSFIPFLHKKLNAGNSILKRIFSCLFSIKAEKGGFSVAFFPAARPLHSATWPRDPFPSLCFVMLQLFKIWLCLGKRRKTAKGKNEKRENCQAVDAIDFVTFGEKAWKPRKNAFKT